MHTRTHTCNIHTHAYTHICRNTDTQIHEHTHTHIQELDKIRGTPGNFKFILIWLSDCGPPMKSGFVQLPSYSFWGIWVLKRVVKLCSNFQSCILVILPHNLHKSLKVFIRKLLLSSRVLLQWGGFSFFLKWCHYFRDCTLCYTK